ncbi:MAG: peptide chain release factor H [Verrucomicrobiota bacterium]
MSAPPEAWVQCSSGEGPLECQRAVACVLPLFEREAAEQGLSVQVLERTPGGAPGCLASALLAVKGSGLSGFLAGWSGTVQWRAPSPFRPRHRRKNWFLGVTVFEVPETPNWDANDISVEAFRAAGPGGQNVNKVSSAVRVIHRPTGLVAVGREERSQQANRKLALARLHDALRDQAERQEASEQASRRLRHYRLVRGNPVRTIAEPLDG